jgi:tripartite-type tricarboxylate transporter receptor subunit TctC
MWLARNTLKGVAQKGYRVNAHGAEAFARYLKEEIDRWGKVVRAAKITPD